MLSRHSLLTFVALALSVAASPVVVVDRSPTLSIPLTRMNNFNSGHNIIAHDQARLQSFRDQANTPASGQTLTKRQAAPVTNAGVNYVASVSIGADNSQYRLLVDTGSSNTWVGANQPYTPSSTSTDTGHSVSVSYGSGNFSGTEYTDQVTLGPSLVIQEQSIGVANQSQGLGQLDGILGIGPQDLTIGSVQDELSIPTVTDNLFSQGTIDENLVAISFEPTTSESEVNGELSFGRTDSSKFTGNIDYVPAIGPYWGIEQSITYGSTSILFPAVGIVDTGTTLLLLPTEALNEYIQATGGVKDESTGLYSITSDQFNNLENLDFNIGDTTYSLTPNAQIWPRSLNTAINGTEDGIYLVVGDAGPLGTDPSAAFTNGYVWLERFYSVYDSGNLRMGFATTPFTTALIN
ncbi:hypothetical protein GYMLUDRAFT_49234 [Collybiopsis luxurians FD-317 M1]|uniref:Peptidase A1 domain-containing protein n=1 Tax=Collybiopsis luxurians FD-317 M1 TaxID=944289 RepID=A0A0D0C720_9AGAR|nr:hypothetical protein GYMLUDRAFT_49234 [Collybiopsis luxurians FD-317 M1]